MRPSPKPRPPVRRLRALAAVAALLTTAAALVLAAPAGAATAPSTSVSGSLTTLIGKLPVDSVAHTGYSRDLFKTWIDADGDGCDTREEVLKAEAVTAPTQGASCALSGGKWYSYYDEATWTDKSDVDIDHLVPLGEVWTSGGYDWSTTRRTDYANDLGDDRTLVAVTDNVNESKGDRDPAHWMPPAASATCTYIDSWVAVKTRWGLTADSAEITALKSFAADCANVTITVTTA